MYRLNKYKPSFRDRNGECGDCRRFTASPFRALQPSIKSSASYNIAVVISDASYNIAVVISDASYNIAAVISDASYNIAVVISDASYNIAVVISDAY